MNMTMTHLDSVTPTSSGGLYTLKHLCFKCTATPCVLLCTPVATLWTCFSDLECAPSAQASTHTRCHKVDCVQSHFSYFLVNMQCWHVGCPCAHAHAFTWEFTECWSIKFMIRECMYVYKHTFCDDSMRNVVSFVVSCMNIMWSPLCMDIMIVCCGGWCAVHVSSEATGWLRLLMQATKQILIDEDDPARGHVNIRIGLHSVCQGFYMRSLEAVYTCAL